MQEQSTETAHIEGFDPSNPIAHSGRTIAVGIAVLSAVLLYYIARHTDGPAVLHAASKIPLYVLAIMVGIQALYVNQQAYAYQQLYAAVGYKRRWSYFAYLHLSMDLVNTVAPVAGLSGSAYMMFVEKGRGMPRSDSLVINGLYYLVDYTVFAVLLLIGLAYLSFVIPVGTAIFGAAAVFLAVAVGLIALTALVASSEIVLAKWLARLGTIARFLRIRVPKQFSTARVILFAARAGRALRRSSTEPKYLIRTAFHCFAFHACSISILLCAFWAVGVAIQPSTVAAAYAVGTLLSIVSITPNGIGVAEGGMTAALTALSVPVAEALVIVLLYRGISTWLPLVVAIPALHAVSAGGERYLDASSTI